MLTDLAGKVAGGLALAAYIPYVIAILDKHTRPNRTTWFIWAVVDALVVGSYFNAGARSTLWVPIGFMIGAITVAVLSLKYGEKSWTWLETICSIGAGASLIVWLTIRSPLPALLLNIAILIFGALPTIKKAYRGSSSENRLAWVLFGLGCLVNLFAIEKWEFAIWIFPVSMFVLDGVIAVLVLWPRKNLTAPI